MAALGRAFTDADLVYLIRIAAPQARDQSALVRALREDADILVGMLRDSRLVNHLLAEPDSVVTASPRVFFAALLVRIRAELASSGFTIEQGERHATPVFDGKAVADLLHRPDVLAYLVEMLVSFLATRTRSLTVRLRKGMWRRIETSDMDLADLIAEKERSWPDESFSLEKRIGDVCLFQSGFYPGVSEPSEREWLAELGRSHYGAASGRIEARELAVAEALHELADGFEMAVKPLAVLARRYVDGLRERVFAI